MLRFIFSIIIVFSLTSPIICQDDCPGGFAAPLAPGSYKWYWDENVSQVKITRTFPFEDLDAPTKVQIVRSAISAALGWFASTAGKITFSEGDENDNGALIIEFIGWGPPSPEDSEEKYGYSPPNDFKIQINLDVNWTDNTSLVEPTYRFPDITTVIVHEMSHIIGLAHASPYSTSAAWYDNRHVRPLTPCDRSTVEDYYNPEYSITVQNSFNNDDDYVNIYNKYNIKSEENTPYYHNERESTWPWDMEAENQNFTYSGKTYSMEFTNWTGYQFQNAELERQDIPMVDDGNYTAHFNQMLNIRFYNGSVYINSHTYQSGETYSHISGTPFDAYANSKTENGLYYTFACWKEGTTTYSTENPGSFNPDEHTDYTIEYSFVKPVWTNRNLHTNSTPGAYITVYWNEHPSSDVVYKIYRKIKHNGVMGSEVLRTTISHGTTQWTDNIQIADEQTTDLVYYDVRAYHTPTSTYSDVDYESTVYTWTEQSIKNGNESANAEMEAEELPIVEENESEIVLGNFPNPFNPTTNISYSLAEDGYVSLKVYNVLGKEVANLVNESKPAGNYSVSFNASNLPNGRQVLPSGVYIYTLQTNGQSFTRKMLLMK